MSLKSQTTSYRDRILERSDIETLIAEGRKILILDGTVIKADAWLPFHPGGDKAVLHMVGRDATNEIRAFHSAQTQEFMKRYAIGKIQEPWKDFIPPIQGGTYNAKTVDMLSEEQTDSSSSTGSSGSNSPLFEPAEYDESTRRRGKQSHGLSQSSSATSLSTLAVDSPMMKAKSVIEDRTAIEVRRDLDIYPSLDTGTQADIIQKYRLLDQNIKAAGLYNCNYAAYGIEFARYLGLAILTYYFLQLGWYLASAICLGLLWHQLVFTVHDAGHMGITHDFQIDTCIGIVIADFVGGLSVCWWKHNHNVHHVVTNSAEHDPDIQHMPFFAVSHRFFDSLRSSFYDRAMTYDAVAKFTLQYQHWLYYPILCFGRFNLYVLSWQYIFLGLGPRKGPARYHRYLEMAGQIFFWYWLGYLVLYKSIPTAGLRVMYLLVSHAMTMPVHAQITLSHFAMSTANLGVAESFPQRMLRTTMDVDCPAWLDFVHGGLQFQAIHHLFPRIPRHNLRACQKLVLDFCEDVNIPYVVYGFTEGSQRVISHLGEIAKQASILAECQRSMTLQDVLDGH